MRSRPLDSYSPYDTPCDGISPQSILLSACLISPPTRLNLSHQWFSWISEAVLVAPKGYLVTIGIANSHPSTGFGYVQLGEKLGIQEAPNARIVPSFEEKPDARTSAAYIATGYYGCNAGVFVTKVSFLMGFLMEYKPEHTEGLTRIAAVWDADEVQRSNLLEEVGPALKK